jgi:hypothetical protein
VLGSIHGTVTDRAGQVCEGAHVALTRTDAASKTPLNALTDIDGRFVFGDVPAGPFVLTVSADGFTAKSVPIALAPAESFEAQPVVLVVSAEAEVQVTASRVEIAQEQLHLEEQQRVLGVMPNFFVSYTKDAPALSTRQKFDLAWKNQRDPVTIAMTALTAGIEQSGNEYRSWGQGTGGYAKRYAAAYGDDLIGTLIGAALLPSLLHQDPRYFYKGTGTKRERVFYAIRSVVVCRGDNGRWQPNYSSLLGSFAAAGISRSYYPVANRDGFGLMVQNIAIGKVTGAAQNILQELFIRKLTPRAPDYGNNKP